MCSFACFFFFFFINVCLSSPTSPPWSSIGLVSCVPACHIGRITDSADWQQNWYRCDHCNLRIKKRHSTWRLIHRVPREGPWKFYTNLHKFLIFSQYLFVVYFHRVQKYIPFLKLQIWNWMKFKVDLVELAITPCTGYLSMLDLKVK